jgi:hypothetical protein
MILINGITIGENENIFDIAEVPLVPIEEAADGVTNVPSISVHPEYVSTVVPAVPAVPAVIFASIEKYPCWATSRKSIAPDVQLSPADNDLFFQSGITLIWEYPRSAMTKPPYRVEKGQ